MDIPSAMDTRYSDVIVEVAKQHSFEDYTISIDRGSAPGGNYLGEIMRATVTGTKNGTKQTAVYIIKVIPRNVVHEMMKVYRFFEREVFMYTDVIAPFDKLQDQFGIKDRFPHCSIYKTCTERGKEAMIMNDLSEQGFVNSAIGRLLDLDHTSLIVKHLGKFHALSLAMKHHRPDEFKTMSGGIKEDLLLTDTMNPFIEKIIRDSTQHALNVLEDPAAAKIVKDMLVNRHDITNTMFDIEDAEPHAVINHGDLWTTNVLFKYQDDKVKDLIFLDWQGCRYHSPVTDLYFLICSSVKDEVRSEHMDSLFDMYYAALSDSLRDLKCDPEQVFPRSIFKDHLKRYSKLSMLVMFIMLPVFTSVFHEFDPEKMDYSRDDIKGIYGSPIATDMYKKRINTVFKDLMDRDLI